MKSIIMRKLGIRTAIVVLFALSASTVPSVRAESIRPVGVVSASGTAYPQRGDRSNPSDAAYLAAKAIDGDPNTFCCLLDDTPADVDDDHIPRGGNAPVTGHLLFDLGAKRSVCGMTLVSRRAGTPLNPARFDLFAFDPTNPDGDLTLTPEALAMRTEDSRFRAILENGTLPPLQNGEETTVPFEPTETRFLLLVVRDSYEKRGIDFNFQIAEVRFATDKADWFDAALQKWRQEDALRRAPEIRREKIDEYLADTTILYVSRVQFPYDHHNTESVYQNGEICDFLFPEQESALKLWRPATGEVHTLLTVPTGLVRDPCIHFSGEKIVVSIRWDKADTFHLYELDFAGRDPMSVTFTRETICQLTFGESLSDIDPQYLPGDKIVFASTREPKFCMCNRHVMANLHVMNADGTNVLQIGHSTLLRGIRRCSPTGGFSIIGGNTWTGISAMRKGSGRRIRTERITRFFGEIIPSHRLRISTTAFCPAPIRSLSRR